MRMDIHQQEREKEEREAARVRRVMLAASDFKAVIDMPEGRRFIRRILSECGAYQSSFNTDPLTMAYKEGRRALGLWLQSLFADCPDKYIQLLGEHSYDRDSEH